MRRERDAPPPCTRLVTPIHAATCPVCGSRQQDWTHPPPDAASLEQVLQSLQRQHGDAGPDGRSLSTGERADETAIAPLPVVAPLDVAARPSAAVLHLAPPAPPETHTPAHRVVRLGDAPESPIHSENPDDWEDLPMPSGDVWRAPKGLTAMGDRAYNAFHVRKAFRRMK